MPHTRDQIDVQPEAWPLAGSSRETASRSSRLGAKFFVTAPGGESPTVWAPAGALRNDRTTGTARPCS
jgi:hypothetical protein